MTDPAPPKSFLLTAELADYVHQHRSRVTDPQDRLVESVLERLVDRTRDLGPVAGMQVAPEQGTLLTLLTRLARAERAVEVGTFTGYSSLCIARGLAPGGRLLCCDVSEEWTAIARDAWADAGLADRVELRLGPATETLASLPSDEPIDIAFIDADKEGYIAYWEALVQQCRPGGLLVADNVLWRGAVLDPEATDSDTVAIRAFNEHVRDDPRVDAVMLAVADGLTVAMRR